MKSLLLVPDSLDNPTGGMGEQAKNLIIHFSNNHKCTVIGSSVQNYTQYSHNKRFIPTTSVSLPLGNVEPQYITLLEQTNLSITALEIFKNEKPDLIHAFDWSSYYSGVVLAKHWQIPLVVTMNLSISQLVNDLNPEDMQMDITQVLNGIEILGLLKADAIIQVAKSYAFKFPAYFYSKTRVIPNGINLEEWQMKSDFKLPGKNKLKIVFLGRFAYQKGLHLLLKSNIPNNIDLIYIGTNKGSNTELQWEIIEQAKNKENIFYLGALYGKDKIKALQAADAVIMPSIHEPFGIVALEALASKSILISSFKNGLSDFLTEDVALNCGIEIESIEKAILKFASMSEEDKAQRIQKGVNLCKQFDWKQIAIEVEEVYEDVLNIDEKIT